MKFFHNLQLFNQKSFNKIFIIYQEIFSFNIEESYRSQAFFYTNNAKYLYNKFYFILHVIKLIANYL